MTVIDAGMQELELERALSELNYFANADGFDINQLPYQTEARFMHARYGEALVQFVFNRVENNKQAETQFFVVNMVFHFQKAVGQRWISAGNLEKIKADISRFAVNVHLVSDIIPEFYQAVLE